ncbi:MAG: hypothetical protein ABI310_07005 [Microbacteriaceae bacterium]
MGTKQEVEVAELTIQGDELVLALSEMEKLEAVHAGEIRVPVTSVRGIEVLDDALDAVHGIRTGTGIPGVLVVGTIRHEGKKAFVVVHHGQPRGVLVRLERADFDELVIGCDDPEILAASLPVSR